MHRNINVHDSIDRKRRVHMGIHRNINVHGDIHGTIGVHVGVNTGGIPCPLRVIAPQPHVCR